MLWRDADDAVQLLRLTGGRLNEVLRMKLNQINWEKGYVRLTCHSLRQTFITDLMEKTGNDAGTVMKYSGPQDP